MLQNVLNFPYGPCAGEGLVVLPRWPGRRVVPPRPGFGQSAAWWDAAQTSGRVSLGSRRLGPGFSM